MEMVSRIQNLSHCFVAVWVTKYLNFSLQPTDIIFSNSCYVFTTDRWDLFAVTQSTLHEVWARKYSGSLKQDLRYSPSKCFDTFAFPAGLWQAADSGLAERGERYHAHRKELMLSLWLGLTKIYNLFHARDLSPEIVTQVSKKAVYIAAAGFEALLELRCLHVELDIAVRDAYGWQDLDLEHGFHEIETLPENDRVRYTISPVARREVVKRLLAENHTRAKSEAQKPVPRPHAATASARPPLTVPISSVECHLVNEMPSKRHGSAVRMIPSLANGTAPSNTLRYQLPFWSTELYRVGKIIQRKGSVTCNMNGVHMTTRYVRELDALQRSSLC